eukprot:TRINITY_DN19569_c0_g1_i1.p1 TRINITY_DN19569_c0_g1~~TRINITY_DN19569_c0_g1_i1.p1  ORF type:complete len:1580 (+),score=322.90 TRINITY_DN19569_c0_g1_i1:62-4741(+)
MTSLCELYLFYCKRGEMKANSSFVTQLRNGDMTVFDFSMNYVGPKGLEPVLEIARHNGKLEELNLSKNVLNGQCATKVVEMAVRHPSLKKINLSCNPLHASCFKPIMYLLAKNKSITELDISNTDIPDHLHDRVKTAVEANKNESPDETRAKYRITSSLSNQTHPDPRVATVHGKWEEDTAGGCLHFTCWRNNRQFLLWPSRSGTAVITLKQILKEGEVPHCIGLAVAKRSDQNCHQSMLEIHPTDLIAESQFGDGRASVTIPLHSKLRGTDFPYTVIPMTFRPGKLGSYSLSIKEIRPEHEFGVSIDDSISTQFMLEAIKRDLDWCIQPVIHGSWSADTAGGNADHSSWRANPQYLIRSEAKSKVFLVLSKSSNEDDNDSSEIGLYVLQGDNENRRQVVMTKEKVICTTPFRQVTSVNITFTLPKGDAGYVLVIACSQPGVFGSYQIYMYSETKLSVKELPRGEHWAEFVKDSSWTDQSNGGCRNVNKSSWIHNPSYALTLQAETDVLAVLQADTLRPFTLSILDNTPQLTQVTSVSSNDGECSLWLPHLPHTVTDFLFVPAMQDAGEVGSFRLHIYASQRVEVSGEKLIVERIAETELERCKEDNKKSGRERLLSFPDEEFKGDAGMEASVVERDEIVDMYLAKGMQHMDKDFPPSLTSVWVDPTLVNRDIPLSSWKRPRDYCFDSSLFKGTVKKGCVAVGLIQDLWFLGAAAVVATNPKLLHHTFLSVYPEYGFYQLRFFKYGKWVPVTIDDGLPVDADNFLLFASSPESEELWPAVLEKAYAKLHSSYESLEISGDIAHALSDLTGGLVETIHLLTAKSKETLKCGLLWEKLQNAVRDQCPVGLVLDSDKGTCHNEKHSMGIPPDHVFPVLEVRDVRGKQLVRLKDCWDLNKWRGRWCDGSKQWTPDILEALEYSFGQDGTFWMAWGDVGYYFTTVHICRLRGKICSVPDPWSRECIEGEWVAGVTDGGSSSNKDTWTRNDQYALHFDAIPSKKPITITVQVEQQDARLSVLKNVSSSNKELVYTNTIGFQIMASDCNTRKLVALTSKEDVRTSEFSQTRFVTMDIEVDPTVKSLTVMPCTEKSGQNGGFLLTVASPVPVRITEIKANMNVSIEGAWKGSNRGGCPGQFGTWRGNPMYLLSSVEETILTLILKQHNDTDSTMAKIGLLVCEGNGVRKTLQFDEKAILGTADHENIDKVTVRVNVKSLKQRGGQPYCIIPSTYFPRQDSNFTLQIVGNTKTTITEIDPNIDYRTSSIEGTWSITANTAGGYTHYPTWRGNPQYYVRFSEKEAKILFVLSKRLAHCVKNDTLEIGFVIFRAGALEGGVRRKVGFQEDDIVAQTDLVGTGGMNHTELTVTLHGNASNGFLVMPCTRYPYAAGDFTLQAYSGAEVNLELPPTEKDWKTNVVTGEWRPGVSAGGARDKHRTWGCNPNYRLTLSTQSNVVLALSQSPIQIGQRKSSQPSQKTTRPPPVTDPSNNTSIGIDLCSDNDDLTHLCRTKYTCFTEVTLSKAKLPPGTYIVVPHTFESEIESEYTLRLYSDTNAALEKVERQRRYY